MSSDLQLKIYEDFLHYFLPDGLLDFFEPVMANVPRSSEILAGKLSPVATISAPTAKQVPSVDGMREVRE